MIIIYKSLHNIDVENGTLHRKKIPDDFGVFMREYIRFATQNENTKLYNIPDSNTTVVNCINKIIFTSDLNGSISEEQESELNTYSHSIANKLLREEIEAQEKIVAMGKKIKKGSLIQAFVKNDEGEYKYIVAKVEHSEWYDSESLIKNFGFPSEKKNVWKSAVFSIDVDSEFSLGQVHIYTDNSAKYWPNQFLELSEKRDDKTNTLSMLKAVSAQLGRSVKNHSERDYYILRDSLMQAMKTSQQINYVEFIDNLVGSYQADDSSIDMGQVRSKLLELPAKKNFDTQFNTVPDAVVNKQSIKFKVTNGVELRINEGEASYREKILGKTRTNGVRYLEIECTDSDTFAVFEDKH